MSSAADLDRAARAIADAGLVVAATGAGMSKESGIPTFREAREGLWSRYDPQQLATRDGFSRDPARVWGWYNYRRGLIADCSPHAGHESLAELERYVSRLVVVTQNIDGLHRRAGSSALLELHGNINRFKCFERNHAVEIVIPVCAEDGPLPPPRCAECGSYIRPDVVWYGEMLPAGVYEEAESLAGSCDVMLVVGTSGLVYPAASLPSVTQGGGGLVIEVNTEPSAITSGADIFLEGQAGQVLPTLVAAVSVIVS
jgi:NAD-dependent deacetylase